MHTPFSFEAIILLFLSLYSAQLSLAAPNQYAAGPKLTVRQTSDVNPQTTLTDTACLDYSRIANLSTVGANSSYRSPFYARSTTGSMYDNRMFSSAILALPKLTADVALNAKCGNLTEVALVEAERNLTEFKVVLQFGNIVPEGIKAGTEVVVIVSGIVLLFFGVWSFMP